MLEAGDFNKLFRDCMPLFIALGDEVRLSIIGVLASTGLYDDHETNIAASLEGYRPDGAHGMNVKEITEQTNLSFKDFKRRRTGECSPGRHFQLLLSDDRRQHKRTPQTGDLSPGTAFFCQRAAFANECRQFMNILVFSRYTIFYSRTVDLFKSGDEIR